MPALYFTLFFAACYTFFAAYCSFVYGVCWTWTEVERNATWPINWSRVKAAFTDMLTTFMDDRQRRFRPQPAYVSCAYSKLG